MKGLLNQALDKRLKNPDVEIKIGINSKVWPLLMTF